LLEVPQQGWLASLEGLKREMDKVKQMTLLEKARAVQVRSGAPFIVTDDMAELAFAWASGDVTVKQVAAALDQKDHATVYRRLATILQHMVMSGLLVPAGWLSENVRP
jgi:hypothetical protein